MKGERKIQVEWKRLNDNYYSRLLDYGIESSERILGCHKGEITDKSPLFLKDLRDFLTESYLRYFIRVVNTEAGRPGVFQYSNDGLIYYNSHYNGLDKDKERFNEILSSAEGFARRNWNFWAAELTWDDDEFIIYTGNDGEKYLAYSYDDVVINSDTNNWEIPAIKPSGREFNGYYPVYILISKDDAWDHPYDVCVAENKWFNPVLLTYSYDIYSTFRMEDRENEQNREARCRKSVLENLNKKSYNGKCDLQLKDSKDRNSRNTDSETEL